MQFSTPATPETLATPLSGSASLLSDSVQTQPSTQMSTPVSAINNLPSDSKPPYQTTYEEYEKFISEIESSTFSTVNGSNVSESPQTPTNSIFALSSIPNPQSFSTHLQSVVHLESRLNYRFLELEAKLRFLRLLTAGTELTSTELTSLDVDSEQLSVKIEKLEIQVNEMKKMGRIIRKKIGKCFHQSEIRRCIEGKPILEDEIDAMMNKIVEYRIFFEENGMEGNGNARDDPVGWTKKLIDENAFGLDLLESNLNKMILEIDELDKTLNDLESTSNTIGNQEELLDEEIVQLEKEKEELEKRLNVLSTHETTNNEVELIKQHEMLSKLVGIWESI